MPAVIDGRISAARAFARSLNVLLKYARLYGYDHGRTASQFRTTWQDLNAAMPAAGDAGVLLGASGATLLLDGVPLESSSADRSFAQMLSASGLASIHFSRRTTGDDLGCLTRAFAEAGCKPAQLASKLKGALAETTAIKINEIRFVAEDPAAAKTTLAGALLLRSLDKEHDQLHSWMNDPHKLLQAIAAAEGAKHAAGGMPAAASGQAGVGGAQAELASSSLAPNPAPPSDNEVLSIFRFLTQVGQHAAGAPEAGQPEQLREELRQLPAASQALLQETLQKLAALPAVSRPDTPMLMQLAEHLAIRYALDRFQRNEVRVNAVREMLDRMAREMDGLRAIIGEHEDKMARSGLLVESHVDILDRQFWASVPEAGKSQVLLSEDAWCIPPRNVVQHVEALLKRGDKAGAAGVLRSYIQCVSSREAEARRKAAMGVSHMAALFAQVDAKLLQSAIETIGRQLESETDSEAQKLLSAAFVRLGQEAASIRHYPSLQQAMISTDALARQRPELAGGIRPRLAVEGRLKDYIEEALAGPQVSPELLVILRRHPATVAAQLAAGFARCTLRQRRDRLFELAQKSGPEALRALRACLESGAGAEAAASVGLLALLQPEELEELLPLRLAAWGRVQQDLVVGQIAASEAPQRGRLLLRLLDSLDELVRPEAIDEIGLSGEQTAVPRLMELAFAQPSPSPFLQLKAIEALGRLRAERAAGELLRLAQGRFWQRKPRELRLAAARALQHIDAAEAGKVLPASQFSAADLSLGALESVAAHPWLRQRRYLRVSPSASLPALASTARSQCRLNIKALSLGGGLAASDGRLQNAADARLELQTGLRPIRARVLLREESARGMSFEIVDMELNEREKLRRLLLAEVARTTNPALLRQQAAARSA